MVIWVKDLQIELLVEIYSKSLARTIGKVFLMKLNNRTPIKTHKGDAKWLVFTSEQLFWWPASMTLDNNNGILNNFKPFLFTLNYMAQLAWFVVFLMLLQF